MSSPSLSDGVIAIILTIMVLELKVPKEPTLAAPGHFWPLYVAYLLSFGNVCMMWVAHHDIVADVRTFDYPMLFANGVRRGPAFPRRPAIRARASSFPPSCSVRGSLC